jgi:hypothetical protein
MWCSRLVSVTFLLTTNELVTDTGIGKTCGEARASTSRLQMFECLVYQYELHKADSCITSKMKIRQLLWWWLTHRGSTAHSILPVEVDGHTRLATQSATTSMALSPTSAGKMCWWRVELEEVEHHFVQQLHIMGAISCQTIAEMVTPAGSVSPKLVAFVQGGGSRNQLNESGWRKSLLLCYPAIWSHYCMIVFQISPSQLMARWIGGNIVPRGMLSREQITSLRHMSGKQEHISPKPASKLQHWRAVDLSSGWTRLSR